MDCGVDRKRGPLGFGGGGGRALFLGKQIAQCGLMWGIYLYFDGLTVFFGVTMFEAGREKNWL